MISSSYEQNRAASMEQGATRSSAKRAGAPFQAPLRVVVTLSKTQAQGLIHIVADLAAPDTKLRCP